MFVTDEVNLSPEHPQSSSTSTTHHADVDDDPLIVDVGHIQIKRSELSQYVREYAEEMHTNRSCSCFYKSGRVNAKNYHSDTSDDTSDDDERLSQFDQKLLDVANDKTPGNRKSDDRDVGLTARK